MKAFILLVLVVVGCDRNASSTGETSAATATDTGSGSKDMTIKVTSPAFQADESIPSKYTCEGQDISPPLAWSGAPAATKSFALIVDDPDAPDPAKPQRVYVHWVVYDIPASATRLPENAAKSGMPSGAMQGTNDWGKQTYGGPCPPIGRHRYFFKLYALDAQLKGLKNPTKAQLEKAMRGHALDNTQLMGTYEKTKKA
jgi:Raf kinase inhibitor-like YbhB/YbcL family protein